MSFSFFQVLLWVLKPGNGLISFFEFIAFITHTPDLVDFGTSSPFYWILAIIIGLWAASLMLHAVWIASVDGENFQDRYFAWALFTYPPIRVVALVAIYLKLHLSNSNLFLFWYDLGAVIVVIVLSCLVAIRAYFQQPRSKPLIWIIYKLNASLHNNKNFWK